MEYSEIELRAIYRILTFDQIQEIISYDNNSEKIKFIDLKDFGGDMYIKNGFIFLLDFENYKDFKVSIQDFKSYVRDRKINNILNT